MEGTNIEYLNVYRLSHHPNIILPYSLCLLVTLSFLVLGINSMRLNDFSASEGFLQLLMNKTGESAVNKAAVAGCAGGKDKAPRDLKEMRVRFSEIVDEEG